MSVNTIIDWIVRGLLLLIVVAIVVVLVVKKVKAKKAKGEDFDLIDIFKEAVNEALGFIGGAEVSFAQLTNGTNAKAGAFKLDNVLNKIRDLCTEKGIVFDRAYWENFIDNAVSLMNIKKSNRLDETSHTEVDTSKNFKYIGVKENEG